MSHQQAVTLRLGSVLSVTLPAAPDADTGKGSNMGEEREEAGMALRILHTRTHADTHAHGHLLRGTVPALTLTFISAKALVSFLAIQHVYWA